MVYNIMISLWYYLEIMIIVVPKKKTKQLSSVTKANSSY